MSEAKAEQEPREPAPPPVAESNETDAHAPGANGLAGEAAPSEAPAAAPEATATAEKGDPLLARGNPLRLVRGGVTAAAGGLLAFLLMANSVQLRFGVPLGTVFVAVAAWGVMDLLGTFDDADVHVARRTTLAALRTPLAATVGSFGLFATAIGLAGTGVGPNLLWGMLIAGLFIAFAASVCSLATALGVYGEPGVTEPRSLIERHGFWLMAVAALLYFPTMGSFSLWDPWETHYGEVAREILARDDWISLWWAQDGWFWSKPILDFWVQALAMAALGVHYRADQMMDGAGDALARPEWIVRTPIVLLTILGVYILYKGVARVFGRRPAFLGAVVLCTVPDWYFLAHQTMTDMACVAPLTATMGLLLLGLHTDEDQRARVYEVKAGSLRFGLSAWHLVFGAVLIVAIPQILYLASRNVELLALNSDGAHGFRVHWDEFKNGSAGNCGLPGNESCVAQVPASLPKGLAGNPDGAVWFFQRAFGAFEPLLQASMWTFALAGVLWMSWGERRVRRLLYLAAWFFAGIATMGKGPMGVVLPLVCAFAYVATKRRWSELLKLEIAAGPLLMLCVALPWYVAMYVRHGAPFTDRLIFHDMFNRAFSHVHDTNEGDDTSFRFYIWQLGYALFPWTALAPLGLTWWLRRSDDADEGKGDASVFLVMWFLFAFALFSFMGTKFHHYIFPAVPPAAMLVGVVVDEMLSRSRGHVGRKWYELVPYGLALCVAMGVCVFGVSRFWPGAVGGAPAPKPDDVVSTGAMALGAGLVGLGAAIAVLAARTFGRRADAPASSRPGLDAARSAHENVMLGAASVAGALVLALVGRDLVLKPEGADQPGAIRLLHLFTYNYRRPWPDSLDFSAILAAFTFVACALVALLAVRAIRAHAASALLALAVVWAVWGLDVYMIKTAPHWGQRELFEVYYRGRKGPDEMIVAYQMNWKGENIYTGNHVPAFVSSGATFTNWVKKKKDEGARVMYFVTEHSRVGGLRAEVGAKQYQELTDRTLNNKFVLVRAEL